LPPGGAILVVGEILYTAYHQIVTFWDFLGNLTTKNATKLSQILRDSCGVLKFSFEKIWW